MEEWKEYKLEEIGTIVGGATPSTKEPHNYDGNISWITPKDLSNNSGRYISRGERMITSEGYNSCSCKMLPKGSVLFSSRAPIGYVAIAYNELCTNQGFKSIIPDEQFVNSTFLYYLLVYNKAFIEGLGSGTTFKEVSGNVMKNVVVKIPCLEIQRQIANVLSSLDDKIEVNRRINDNFHKAFFEVVLIWLLTSLVNDNLEQQAQALFKSWFVDFEPFRDQPFVESELGMIPEGWRVMLFKDVCDTITDGVHNTVKDDINGKYYLLSCKNIKGGQISIGNSERKINREVFEKLRKRTNLQKGDILLSSVGTIGEIVLLNESPYNYEFQRSVAMIKPNTNLISPHFLYYTMKVQKDNIIHSAHGAVQQCLFISDIANFKTICPPYNIIQHFTNIVFDLHDMISNNREESRRLAQLRDTLLPRLMSGEIKVNEIKEIDYGY